MVEENLCSEECPKKKIYHFKQRRNILLDFSIGRLFKLLFLSLKPGTFFRNWSGQNKTLTKMFLNPVLTSVKPIRIAEINYRTVCIAVEY
jgi:hypothetical protein